MDHKQTLYLLLTTLLNLYCIVPHEDKCRFAKSTRQTRPKEHTCVVCLYALYGGREDAFNALFS